MPKIREMVTAFAPGLNERIVVLFGLEGAREPVPATVRRVAQASIEVELESEQPAGGSPIAILVEDASGHRLAHVIESATSELGLLLKTDGRWRLVLERRTIPRYPTLIPCTLTTEGATASATCLDLSTHGANLEVPEWPPVRFTLTLPWGDLLLDLPCEAVAHQRVLGMDIVHARFLPLSGDARKALDGVVRAVRESCLRAQAQLAWRANDPPHTPGLEALIWRY